MYRPFPVLLCSLICFLTIDSINGRLYKLQANKLLISNEIIREGDDEILYVFMEPPSVGFHFQSVESAMLAAWLELAEIKYYIFSTQFLLASPQGKPIFAQWKGEYLEGVDQIINTMGKWKLENLKATEAKEKKNEKKNKQKKNEEKRKKEVEKEWKEWQKKEEKELLFVGAIKDLHKILLKYWLDGKNRFEWMINNIEERIWFTLLLPIVAKNPILIELDGRTIGEKHENEMKLKIDEQLLREYYDIIMDETETEETKEKKLEFMKKYGILNEKEEEEEDDFDGIVEVEKIDEKGKGIWENFVNKMKSLNKDLVENELKTIRREKEKLRENLPNLSIKVMEKTNKRFPPVVGVPYTKTKTITKKLAECNDEDLMSSLKILFKTMLEECEYHTYTLSHLFDKKVPGKSEAYLLGLLFFIFEDPPFITSLPKFTEFFEQNDVKVHSERFKEENLQKIFKFYKKTERIFSDEKKNKMVGWPWPMMKCVHVQQKNMEKVEIDMAQKIQEAIHFARLEGVHAQQVDYPWLEGFVDSPLK